MNEKTLIRIISDLVSQLESVVTERDNFKQWWLEERKKNEAAKKENKVSA